MQLLQGVLMFLQSCPLSRQQGWVFMLPHLPVVEYKVLCRENETWDRKLSLASAIPREVFSQQPVT